MWWLLINSAICVTVDCSVEFVGKLVDYVLFFNNSTDQTTKPVPIMITHCRNCQVPNQHSINSVQTMKINSWNLTLWRPLLPYGLRQSARMSKITNDGLTRSGTGCFIAVPIRQQWASKGRLNFSRNDAENNTALKDMPVCCHELAECLSNQDQELHHVTCQHQQKQQ